MGKLDELKRTVGANVVESAARRYDPVISPASVASLNPARMDGVARSKAAMEIPLGRIERDPSQPREEFDDEALSRLAESIRERGLLQPIRVRWDEGRGVYVLIAGERRWRAARMAGLATLTCIVADGELSPAELLAVQCIENLQREDLRPMERAKAFRTLMGLNGWSGNQLAKELGVSQSSVVHALSLLDLPAGVQGGIERGEIAPSVGYELSKLGDAGEQERVAERIVAEGMTRADAVAAVRRQSATKPKGKSRGTNPRKATARTFRTPGGPKVTIEYRKGLDGATIAEAMRYILTVIEAESDGGREQAA